MPVVVAYHRPERLPEALALMAEPHRVVLAGGTVLNADREPSALEAVDLQALGLDGIQTEGDRLRLGATATLDAVRRSDLVPPTLAAVARAEAPSTLRTLATIGGTVASVDGESLLLAALLAHDAVVETNGTDTRPIAEVLAAGVGRGVIITAVTIDPSGDAATATTGRTPADVPIVGAYGRRAGDDIVVALTGVADQPVLVDAAAPTEGLAPPADFRGTSEYRLELAEVLTRRVVRELA